MSAPSAFRFNRGKPLTDQAEPNPRHVFKPQAEPNPALSDRKAYYIEIDASELDAHLADGWFAHPDDIPADEPVVTDEPAAAPRGRRKAIVEAEAEAAAEQAVELAEDA